jgi:hypothetical protein
MAAPGQGRDRGMAPGRKTGTSIALGDCVRLRDGRIARVRQKVGNAFKLRVRRTTSATHQFLLVQAAELERVPCPEGWMSPTGYRRYLRATLQKMRERDRRRRGA